MRTREAEKMVLARFSEYKGQNLTQYYSVANALRGGEVRIDTYACRLDGKTRKPIIKCIQRCYSDRKKIDVRDVYRGYMGGFQIDFSDVTRNCRHYAESYYRPESLEKFPVGTWDTMDYEGVKTGFLIPAPIINDLTGTNYEHCGLKLTNLHPMKFFECYHISHSVEFLAKNNLSRFITPSFVRRLRNEKRLFDFFRMNFKAIKGGPYGIKEVTKAVARKCSLVEAADRIRAAEEFKDSRYYTCENIPEGIDRYELYKWCKKNRISPHTYRRYAGYIDRICENLCAYGVTYPSDFSAALEAAEAEAHRLDEIERRRKARRRREEEKVSRMNAKERKAWERKEHSRIKDAIADMAKKLAKLNGITGYGYAVVVPKSAKMLLDEGNAMKNCIGKMGYDKKIANGESLIFFLRGQDGRKNVDVEVRVRKYGKSVKLEVAQCYNPCNQNPPEEAKIFARQLADMAKTILYRKVA